MTIHNALVRYLNHDDGYYSRRQYDFLRMYNAHKYEINIGELFISV